MQKACPLITFPKGNKGQTSLNGASLAKFSIGFAPIIDVMELFRGFNLAYYPFQLIH
jgi:hypothetical protein